MKDVSSSGSAKPSQLRRGPIPDSYWLIDGVLLAGRYPGAVDEALAIDKLTKFLDAGIRTFIDLTETTEPLAKYDGVLRTLSAGRGVETKHVRIPVRDRSVPDERPLMTRIPGDHPRRNRCRPASLRALLGRHWPDGNGRRLLARGIRDDRTRGDRQNCPPAREYSR